MCWELEFCKKLASLVGEFGAGEEEVWDVIFNRASGAERMLSKIHSEKVCMGGNMT
jgi:hypothetical protein